MGKILLTKYKAYKVNTIKETLRSSIAKKYLDHLYQRNI